jgi:hypothetical protein
LLPTEHGSLHYDSGEYWLAKPEAALATSPLHSERDLPSQAARLVAETLLLLPLRVLPFLVLVCLFTCLNVCL